MAVSDEAWAEAVRREAVIRPLCAAPRVGRVAIALAVRDLGLSQSRIYALLEAFRVRPVTASLLPSKSGPARGSQRLAPGMEARIDAAIEASYLTRERPTLTRLMRELRRDCLGAGLTPPSMKALRARVRVRSLRERMAARQGAAAAGNHFRLVKRGLRAERPLQLVQIDHTKVDLMLVDDVTRACIGRPWLTLVLDLHTRLVLGLYLSLDAPSATSAALALAQAVLPKAEWLADRGLELAWPAHGLPEVICVDNGREFHSRAFERGCQQHGIQIAYRPPATPRFGGHIERLMGTLMGRVQALPGSTFSNVAARGGYDSEAKALLSFGELERILALEVLGPYHNEIHRAPGRAPAAAWAEGARPREGASRWRRLSSCLISCPSKSGWCAVMASGCSISFTRTGRWRLWWSVASARCGSNTIRAISAPCSSSCRPASTFGCPMPTLGACRSHAGSTGRPPGGSGPRGVAVRTSMRSLPPSQSSGGR